MDVARRPEAEGRKGYGAQGFTTIRDLSESARGESLAALLFTDDIIHRE